MAKKAKQVESSAAISFQGPMAVSDVIAYAAKRQMEIDNAPEFEKIIDAMELENEIGYLLEQAGYKVDLNLVERYAFERPEVKFRRATFKVVK